MTKQIPKRIVAIDPSITATGYAIYDSAKEIRERLNVFTLKSIRRGPAYLAHAASVFENAIYAGASVGLVVGKADLVIMEGYSFGSRGRAVFQLGELGGVLRMTAFRMNVPVVEIAPGNLKKFATGKGNAGKDQMLATAIRKLPYDGYDHNEADALWLLAMAFYKYGLGADTLMCTLPLTQYQREALKVPKWPELL